MNIFVIIALLRINAVMTLILMIFQRVEGNDTGIDGIGIIVNGELINNLMSNEEAIDAILKS